MPYLLPWTVCIIESSKRCAITDLGGMVLGQEFRGAAGLRGAVDSVLTEAGRLHWRHEDEVPRTSSS